MSVKRSLLIAFATCAGVSHAALFSGGSFFSLNPQSQVGVPFNNLTLTDTPTGFIVSGQVMIVTPPGFTTGTLLHFEVSRALDPSFGVGTAFTSTQVIGFSSPPPGTFGNTSGTCRSFFTNYPGVSESIVPLTLPGGTNTWNISANSGPFGYTSFGTNYLTQVFDIDGTQLTGPGGNWIVDVPTITDVQLVPEPVSMVVISFGIATLLRSRKKSQ